MTTRALLFTLVFLLSAIAAQASDGFNGQVRDCASLLPRGKMYQVALEYEIDQTGESPSVAGSFTINWAPGYTPSQEEEEAAFKELEPFILCLGPILTGTLEDGEK